MKHAAAWLVALALSAATPSPILAKDTTMTNDMTAIHQAVEDMTAAFTGGDITRTMQSYDTGAVVVFEPQSPVSDADQLHAMFTAMSAMKPAFSYSGHEVFVSGDTGLHIAPWTMTATGPDGSEIAQSGLSVAVFRRQQDGTWKMVIDNPHGQFLMQQ
ncbi:MAG: YybH family protein [Pelagimonas sp.]|uniref:YybH family protein n=1 Tax=Pelagimonas sp. TaxID=2073170 RepID=UPI003D6AC303